MSLGETSLGKNGPTTEKETIDPEKRDVVKKHQLLINEFNALLDRYKAVETKNVEAEKKLNEARHECKQTQQQLAHESSNRIALKKDNDQLRALITEMSNAQEPLREEKHYLLDFSQIGIDVESWAAKETRAMSKQSLSESDCHQIFSGLYECGKHGKRAAEWFEAKDKTIFQERKNRITLVRHVIAIILFDRILDQFAFGFKPDYSEYFKRIETQLCLNSSSIYEIN
jgi:chromosome segregation ATPase